jgi:hypothetical protein
MNTLTSEQNEAAAFAVAMSAETIETCKAVNNTLETTQKTSAFYGTHYANPEMDSFGIMGIVCEVLTECEAVFARGIESTELRKIALAVAPTTKQVIALAKPKFAVAGLRYKPQAVKNILSTYGTQKICRIKLTTGEIVQGARSKWYLIQENK